MAPSAAHPATSPPPPPPPSVSLSISLSMPLTLQAGGPPSRAQRPSCPPPRTDAPRAASLADLPTEVHAVVASSTNAGWIAAWSQERVLVSRDAGRTFARVLDGAGDVHAVTFDCYGNVIALRGGDLGIREGTRETWQRLPRGLRGEQGDPAALIGGGPDVVVIATAPGDTWRARAAVSADRGTTWWYRDLVDYWESSHATGHQTSDGTIHVALTTADCMHDPVFWLRIRDGVVDSEELGSIGHVALDGDRAFRAGDDGIESKRFGEASWRRAMGPRGKALLAGRPDLDDRRDEGRRERVGRGRRPRRLTGNHRRPGPHRAGHDLRLDRVGMPHCDRAPSVVAGRASASRAAASLAAGAAGGGLRGTGRPHPSRASVIAIA
jgi:hypothetical protein